MSLVQTYKALADESRLRILRVLLRGRYSVAELQEIVEMGQSRVSRHLKLLLDAGFVRVHREGTWAYYEAGAEGDDGFVGAQLKLLDHEGGDLDGAGEDEVRRLGVLERRREKSRAFHDRVAPEWSRLRDELFGDASVASRVLAPLAGASIVADLGCGSGVMLGELARGADRVIGVDASPAMLEEAARKLGAADTRVELRLGTLEHLPLADGEANAALMNMVLHHLADPPAVLAEVRRVLAPGGRLVVCDLASHDEEWMREKYGDQWLGFTQEEISRFLDQAGFEQVSFEQHTDTPRAGILLAVARTKREGGEP